jgi:hypothetical protein
MRVVRFVVVSTCAFVSYFITFHFAHPVASNNYVYLANAWLHGHVRMDAPLSLIDGGSYGGKYYNIEGPLPTVLMLLPVALHGLDANQSFVCTRGIDRHGRFRGSPS